MDYGTADLRFLQPLFDLSQSQLSARAVGHRMDERSSMAADDARLNNWWASTLVHLSITTGCEQIWALNALAARDAIGNASPWATIRAVIENFATAVALVAPPLRLDRLRLALQMWHYDYDERTKWERDRGSSEEILKFIEGKQTKILGVADQLGIPQGKVKAALNYSDLVRAAAKCAGLDANLARAHWRVASGYAHARFWPSRHMGEIKSATPLGAGGATLGITLHEGHLRDAADLALAFGQLAVITYQRRRVAI
jgi:hypothetical protein